MLSSGPCDEFYFVYFRQFDTVERKPGTQDKSQYYELSAILCCRKRDKRKTCLNPIQCLVLVLAKKNVAGDYLKTIDSIFPL